MYHFTRLLAQSAFCVCLTIGATMGHAETCPQPDEPHGLTAKQRALYEAPIRRDMKHHADCRGRQIESACYDMDKLDDFCHLQPADTPLFCLGEIKGIDQNGDGFLSVRVGPGRSQPELGRFRENGIGVVIFERVGNWLSVDVEGEGWHPPCTLAQGEKMWVHRNYVKVRGSFSP